jgi:TolB-like protein/DNA-binding winged helix-turn-helix (wHTH) protein/Tfp pilus assembly protein PilF
MLRLSAWQVKPEMGSIACDGKLSHVSPKAMEVLLCLVRRQGQVVSKDEIFREVWAQTFVSDDALTQCIVELRRAFHDHAREPSIIQTIPKRGFVLLVPVIREEDDGQRAIGEVLDTREENCEHSAAGVSVHVSTGNPVEPDHPIWQLSSRGRRLLMIAAGCACLAVILSVVGVQRWLARERAASPRSIRSIAVLPLANLSGDPEQEYFADGMTEQLITELARARTCDVISRTSIMRYKGSKLPLRDIARELSVDGIVEGTVLRSGNRVRVTAQLINANTDRHIWSDSFERDISDVIALQAGIATAIAEQLNVTLSPLEQDRLQGQRIVPEAYEAYLRGWYFFDRAQYVKAGSYFEQATVADPNFALGHAMLFESDSMASFIKDSPRLSERALKALQRARELDDSLAEVHDGIADVLLMDKWDWEGAGAEYRRAVELNPASVDAALHYIYWLHMQRRWSEAQEQINRALRIDPVSPTVNHQKLALLVDMHQWDAALEQYQRTIELDPGRGGAHWRAQMVFGALGREDERIAAFLKAEAANGATLQQQAELSAAAREAGFSACIKKRVAQLKQGGATEENQPTVFASFYVALGDLDSAFRLYQKAVREHRPHLLWINAHTSSDPMRSDPRFQTILREMHFPD